MSWIEVFLLTGPLTAIVIFVLISLHSPGEHDNH